MLLFLTFSLNKIIYQFPDFNNQTNFLHAANFWSTSQSANNTKKNTYILPLKNQTSYFWSQDGTNINYFILGVKIVKKKKRK